MSKAVLVGVTLAGLAALAFAVSRPDPVPTGVPIGWEPPPGAVTVSVPDFEHTLGFPVRGASWQANGQEVVLWWDPTDPATFLAMQSTKTPTGQVVPAVLAMGSTEHSQKLLSIMKNFKA